MIKTYCVSIAEDMVEYFENRLKEKDVKTIFREPMVDPEREPHYLYIVTSKEGVINPKYEVRP